MPVFLIIKRTHVASVLRTVCMYMSSDDTYIGWSCFRHFYTY